MNNQNPNIFYISSENDSGGIHSIQSYNISTSAYNIVFNLSSPVDYSSSYGLAQDFTGLNLYIGISNSRILRGVLSGTSVVLWLTLPQTVKVIGLVFTANYTLIANTSNGYGYIINIDPSTGIGTYNSYYDTTSASIIGGLGLNVYSTFLYGISTTQVWKVKRYPLQTGYIFLYSSVPRDFVEIFDTSNPGSTITNYKSAAYGGLDLGQVFTAGSSLVTTSYTSNLLSGNDLSSYFALINTGAKVWSPLSSGTDEFVQSIAINYTTGNVYASGIFITAGGVTVNNIAMWNGSSWSTLGGGCDAGVSVVKIDPANGNVYAGGFFTTAGGLPANYIAMWNGTSWSPLGNGCGPLETIAVFNSTNVYAGGFFTTAGGVPANYIAKWNGSNWSALGSGFNTTVNAIAVDSANNVYAGGAFTTTGGLTVNRIAKWNGLSWSALIDATTGVNGCGGGDVYNIAIDSANNVYVCGFFTTAGGVTVNRIAKWNGTNWFALGSGVTASCWDIAIDSANNVYAAGYYTTAGGIPANYIAKWNGTIWSTLIDANTGINGTNSILSAVAIDVVGNVYVGGGFDQAGGKSASNIAIYGEPRPIIVDPPTNVCYKTVTISWGNVGTPINYTLTQTGTSSATYTTTLLSYVVTNLINGSSYTFTVTANYSGGYQVTSLPLTQIMPATSTYFPGSPGVQSGSDYIITFTSPGTNTLTYSCPGVIVNCNLLLVGGGGGGAGGNQSTGYSGGGGGGGYIYNNTASFSTTNSVIVGNGGNGSGSNGSNGSASSFLSYIANGGNGGSSSDGLGGTGNGNGGNGVNTNIVGNIGGASSLIPYSGGGGSGAGTTIQNKGGGGAGTSGSGGSAGIPNSGTGNGQSASTYGGGGGGGCGFFYFGSGGNGYQGVVIFTIPN
jgi:hypothetical protein